ncbi:unnamed protein product, partial [Polarella glacialis]
VSSSSSLGVRHGAPPGGAAVANSARSRRPAKPSRPGDGHVYAALSASCGAAALLVVRWQRRHRWPLHSFGQEGPRHGNRPSPAMPLLVRPRVVTAAHYPYAVSPAASDADAVSSARSQSSGMAPMLVGALCLFLVLLHRLALRKISQPLPVRFVVAVQAAMFFVLSLLTRSSAPGPGSAGVRLAVLVGAVDFLGWMALQRVAAAQGLGIAAALLSGASLVYSMGLSRLFIQRQFRSMAWIGALLITFGVAYSGPSPSGLPSIAQALPLPAAWAFSGLALIGKEAMLSGAKCEKDQRNWRRRPLSVPTVAFVSSFALLLALAAPQVGFALGRHTWSLREVASLLLGPVPMFGDLSISVLSYIAASGVLRLTLAWALRASSATTVQLVNAVAIPFGAAMSTLAEPAPVIPKRLLLALGTSLVGSSLYFFGHPSKVEDEEAWQAFQEKAKEEAATKAKAQAERKVKEEAAKKAKEEAAQQKAKEQAEMRTKQEAEKTAKENAAKKAKEEAAKKAQEIAQQKVKEHAEMRAKQEAEKTAKEEALKLVQEEAERKVQEIAQQKAKEQVEMRTKQEAEKTAKEEAAKKAKEEAAKKAQEIAQQKAQEQAEMRAKQEAEKTAKEEAAKKAIQEAAKKAQEIAQQKAKEQAEMRTKQEAEKTAKEEALKLVQEEAERKVQVIAQQKANEQAEMRTKQEAEKIAKEEAAKKAKEEAAKKAQEIAQQKAQEQAEMRAKQEAEKTAKEEAAKKAIQEAVKKAQEMAQQKAKEQAEMRAVCNASSFNVTCDYPRVVAKLLLESVGESVHYVGKDFVDCRTIATFLWTGFPMLMKDGKMEVEGHLRLLQKFNLTRYDLARIGDIISYGCASGGPPHASIVELRTHSKVVDFVIHVRRKFLKTFGKYQSKFPGVNGEALFIGTILHSLDHSLGAENMPEPLWLDVIRQRLGQWQRLGALVFYKEVYSHALATNPKQISWACGPVVVGRSAAAEESGAMLGLGPWDYFGVSSSSSLGVRHGAPPGGAAVANSARSRLASTASSAPSCGISGACLSSPSSGQSSRRPAKPSRPGDGHVYAALSASCGAAALLVVRWQRRHRWPPHSFGQEGPRHGNRPSPAMPLLVRPRVVTAAHYPYAVSPAASDADTVSSARSQSSGMAPVLVGALCLFLVLLHRLALRTISQPLPNRFVVAVHAAMFFVLSLLTRSSAPGPSSAGVRLAVLVGAVEFLGWMALQRVAAAQGLGIAAALLSGASLVYSMGLSRLFIQRQFRSMAWIGALLITFGVAYSGPSLSGLPSIAQALPLLAAWAFSGLALIGKEAMLSGAKCEKDQRNWRRRPLSVPTVAFVSSFALLLALAAPQVGFALGRHTWSLREVASLLLGPVPMFGDLSISVLSYIAASGVLRLTLAWALRASSATTVQLVNAVAVPFGAAMLTLAEPAPVIPKRLLLALGTSLVGSSLYFFGHPSKVEDEEAWQAFQEKAKEEAAKKAKAQAERKVKEEAAKKAKEEAAQQKAKEQAEMRTKQEEEKTQASLHGSSMQVVGVAAAVASLAQAFQEKAKEEAAKKAKAQAERKVKEEAAKKAKEEAAQQKAKEQAEMRTKQEAEKTQASLHGSSMQVVGVAAVVASLAQAFQEKAKEEAAKKAKAKAERKVKEEAAKKAKEEAAQQKAKEQAEMRTKQEAEKIQASLHGSSMQVVGVAAVVASLAQAFQEKAKEEAAKKAKAQAERKVKEEAAKKAKEEAAQQKAKEQAEMRTKQEAEKIQASLHGSSMQVVGVAAVVASLAQAFQEKAKEEAAKKAKAQAERKVKEEAAKKAKEEAAQQKAKEQAEMRTKQEAEKTAKEEAAKKAKEEAAKKAQEIAQQKARNRQRDANKAGGREDSEGGGSQEGKGGGRKRHRK